MQQTLLCLAAVLVFSLFGLSRHRALAADERAEVRRETEAAALATAERWAATLTDAAFDEADLDRTQPMRLAGQTTGLTPKARFGAREEATVAAFDDIDDYAGYDRTETARAALGLVLLRVHIDVAYADPATFAPVSGSLVTTAKVAVVTVTEVRTDGQTRVTATLPVRVTPASQFLHS